MTKQRWPTRLGIFGGSFNPIHNGHMEAIRIFKHELHLDTVLLIPSGAAFYKQTALVAFEHRYCMCQLAIQGMLGVAVSDVERRHHTGMYSCDMLAAVARLYPDATLFFLMGSDVYERVPVWKGLEQIAALATLAVIPRSGTCQHLEATATLLKQYELQTLFVHEGQILSSTTVRTEREQGQAIDCFVPAAVAQYIADHQLYMKT